MEEKIKEIEKYCRHDYAYFYSSTAREHVQYLLFYIKKEEERIKELEGGEVRRDDD